jgi:hypothetical protein
MLETAIAEVPQATADTDDNGVWIEALPARVYHTPQYGEVPIPVDKLQRMITHFKSNVRGQEIATDFEHGMDQAKGKQASGWYKDFEVRPSSDDPTQMSLWANVQLTKEAKQDVQDGKWKYWSLEWDDEYETDTGAIVPDVVIGGGLTNRPVAKRTMPINFSEEMWNELDDDTQKKFAVWSTAYVNKLPNSAFLYVEAGASPAGGSGVASKRHLPYKDSNGKIDLPHLRNAIARIPQMKGISAEKKASLQARARRLLSGSSKAASEQDVNVQQAFELLTCAGFDIGDAQYSENAAWAHSDPGITAPLYGATEQPDPGFGLTVPRVTGNPDDDKAIGGGWRREPLPAGEPTPPGDTIDKDQHREPSGRDKHFNESKGGKTVEFTEEDVTELRRLLAIPDDADSDAFMSVARNAFSELKTFKDSVGQSTQEKNFSEQFPDVWAEHQRLLEANRTGGARAFAESVQRLTTPKGEGDNITFEPTRNGLSALALDTIAETHKKFSEGTATTEDYENTIKAIVNGGIVEFGEVGSSAEKDLPAIDTATAQGIANTRKVFAEKVAEVQEQYKNKNDGKELEFSEAVAKTSEMYPDLAAAYRATAA